MDAVDHTTNDEAHLMSHFRRLFFEFRERAQS